MKKPKSKKIFFIVVNLNRRWYASPFWGYLALSGNIFAYHNWKNVIVSIGQRSGMQLIPSNAQNHPYSKALPAPKVSVALSWKNPDLYSYSQLVNPPERKLWTQINGNAFYPVLRWPSVLTNNISHLLWSNQWWLFLFRDSEMFSSWPPPIQTDSISSQSFFLINATLVLTLKYPYFKPLFPNSRIHVFNKYLLSTTYHALCSGIQW